MNDVKGILIVSYKLGTGKGVGGRRWLNYGSELLRKGHNVFFLTYQEEIPDELMNYKDRVFFINGNYPKVLDKIPTTIFEKIAYRFWMHYLNIVSKGDMFDATRRTKRSFLKKVMNIIGQKNIDVVITSGGPYSLLEFGICIKELKPNIKLLSDYRDAWTNGAWNRMKTLPKNKFAYELNKEKDVLGKSDVILVASEDTKKRVLQIDKTIDPVILINSVSCISFDDIEKRDDIKTGKKEILITHLGSLNEGTEKYWAHFAHFLIWYNNTHDIKLVCEFVGGVNKEFKEFVTLHNISNIKFIPEKHGKELAKILQNSDVFIFFKNDGFPDSFPTKFFDYVCFRKPLLCYTIDGIVSREIEMHKLGSVITTQMSQEEIKHSILKLLNTDYFNKKYDYEKFTMPQLIQTLENCL